MRVAPKAVNDRFVFFGSFKHQFVGKRPEQQKRGILVLGGFAVFERQIEKSPLRFAQFLIDLLLQRFFRRLQGDRVRGKGAGVAAIKIAREFVPEQ